jgi:hypothetical protein
MPDAMRPIPIEAMPGCSAWASFSALRQLSEATGIGPGGQILAELLHANPRVLEEAVPRLIINPDGSRWSGSADDVPLSLLELGRLLGDAVCRRLTGEPLPMEDASE